MTIDNKPYATGAPEYWERGWRGGGVPVPPGTKQPALKGVTGYDGVDLSYPDVLELIEAMPGHNIALRLPANVIGIDVDHYDEKRGGDTLAHAESLRGTLPYSPRSTSRVDDPISGIRLYRVPPGLHWASIIEFPELGLGDIEIVQRTHRFAMVWPSIHPKTGLTYYWLDDDGNVVEIPRPEDLPELPAKWVGALYRPSTSVRLPRNRALARAVAGEFAPADMSACLTDGVPEGRVKFILNRAKSELLGGSRFDHTRNNVLALLRCGKDGDPGVGMAIDELRDEYVSAVTLDGSRTYPVATLEFNRMITSPGAGLLLAQPSHKDLFANFTPTHTSAKAAEAAKANQEGTSAASAAFAEVAGDSEPQDDTDPSAASAAFAEVGEDSETQSDNDTAQPETEEPTMNPIPLTTSTVAMPPFPVESLPKVIANMVSELAEATQTDPAMAGTTALTVLAGCAGGHAKIEIRRGWREPLCVFCGTVARPGERKSAVQSAMTRPLNTAEAEMGFAGQVERLARQDELDVAKKRAEKLANAAATAAVNAAKPDATDAQKTAAKAAEKAALEAAAEARDIAVPSVPRLLADDVTPEAASSLLAENGGRIAIISAEGGLFDILAGRYAKGVNLDPFLKGHAGDPIRVDRKGRAPEYIPSPALTLGLMFQPRVLEAIAANRDFAGRGLLARFLYARPESKVGSRSIAAAPVSKQTESAYNCAILKLASEMSKWVDDPAVLQLSPKAEQAMRAIEEWVEPQLAGGGALASPPTLTEWASKYAGAVARIAGLLHLAEHGESGVRGIQVGADTVLAASKIGQYYVAAATNVFSEMATDEDTADAIYLLDRVEYLGKEVVSQRDLFTAASRSRFPTAQSMLPALKRLVDHGYLIQQQQQPTGGRPASPTFKVVATSAKAAEAAEGAS